MRLVTRHPSIEAATLEPSEERMTALRAWIDTEVEDSHASRYAQDNVWRQRLREYEGVPRTPVRNVPVENAPNIEVTLGAIATDAVYAQGVDLIYSASPLVTCRSVDNSPEGQLNAKALQRFVNWGVANEWRLREAFEHTILDDVQLGTGLFYIPWVEHKKKTKVAVVESRGPVILSLPLEDFFVPAGAGADLQREPWIAFRSWLTEGEKADAADAQAWLDPDAMAPVGTTGWVRSRRETLGNQLRSRAYNLLYEVWTLYCYFDIDGDGIEEDLLVVWDRGSRTLQLVAYNDYDRRAVEAMRYQIRAHLFYGMGVMDMISPFQRELTEIHNARVLNMLLANSRMWKAKDGSVPDTMKVWPGKVVHMQNPEDLDVLQMADVYPSSAHEQQFMISLAERRVGVNDLSTPRPSQIMGSRTPGITAMTLMQSSNRRFAPAFGAIREGTAAAIRQCLYRYQERILSGDALIEGHLVSVLGPEDGQRVMGLLRDPAFDKAYAVEMTAASASVNREADRQNAMLLAQLLAAYYDKTLQLVAIAAQPQTPEPVRNVARKIATSAGEIIDRTIRTFDQIRDPATFIVNVNEELDAIPDLASEGMNGLAQLLSGALGGGVAPAALPEGVSAG